MTRSDAEIEILQQFRTVSIGEADRLVANLSLDVSRVQATVTAGNLHRGVNQIQHPVGGGHGALIFVQGSPESGQRPQQTLGDEHQKAVGANGNHTLGGLQSSDQQNRQEGKQNGEADQWNESG